MKKTKVILFGAGDGGLRVYYALNHEFETIAFIDNDSNKQGQKILNKPIISPNEISKFDYDYVIIANIHGIAIKKQLIEELQVPPEKIIDYYQNQIFDTRIAVLRQVAIEIYDNGVEGNVAELGVFKGEFARYINESFLDRKLYLFDTFNGFDERDIVQEKAGQFSNSETGDFSYNDIQSILHKMKKPENCIIKKGYFPDSAVNMDERFAFVSIDVDLYAPIYEGLDYFYPRLNPGGYIFVHDYNSTRFFGVKQAVQDYCRKNGVRYVPINDLCGSAVIIK